jgi:ELWxxDGT repeat protein
MGLWKSDGTAAGTVHVYGDPGSWPEEITPSGTRLYFIEQALEGTVLRRTNGTAATTKSMGDLNPGWLTDVAGTLFFEGYIDDELDDNDGLWRSDGTKASTVLVKAIPNLAYLTYVWPDDLFFRNSEPGDRSLWSSDGTGDGTESLLTVDDTMRLEDLTHVAGRLYLNVGDELYRSDGTVGGTEPIAELGDVQRLTNDTGILFFTADDGTNGRELWFFGPG